MLLLLAHALREELASRVLLLDGTFGTDGVAAVLGVVACRMLRLPPMLGYLAVGVLIGPNALGIINTDPAVHLNASFGWPRVVGRRRRGQEHNRPAAAASTPARQ